MPKLGYYIHCLPASRHNLFFENSGYCKAMMKRINYESYTMINFIIHFVYILVLRIFAKLPLRLILLEYIN